MHTMSDQIGDNDDFDRDSRLQQYQNELNKQKAKKMQDMQSDNDSDGQIDNDNDEGRRFLGTN